LQLSIGVALEAFEAASFERIVIFAYVETQRFSIGAKSCILDWSILKIPQGPLE
jgi:hypothetical protein